MSVLIVDYGLGNLLSVKRAFEKCKSEVFISNDPSKLKEVDHIVLPGVGTFRDGMKNLTEQGWIEPLINAVKIDNKPILGICLGMQLLANRGFEGGSIQGLGLIDGEVRKISSIDDKEKVPHVGWNEVNWVDDVPIFKEINTGTDFYFVHSYEFVPRNKENIAATTPYCGGFVSSVYNNNIYGVQFHPEKSQKPGFKLIKNFISL